MRDVYPSISEELLKKKTIRLAQQFIDIEEEKRKIIV